jgi:class I fructose-bisphosphate aldolase
MRNAAGQRASGPAVVVRSAAEATAVLEVAGGMRPLLLSAPGAAGVLGPRGWRALIARAARAAPGVAFEDALCCGAAPGHALAALRAGCRLLVLADCPGFAAVAGAAAEAGALLWRERPEALDLATLDLRKPGGRARIAQWLAAAPMTQCSSRARGHGTPPALKEDDAAMRLTPKVQEILSWYESDNPGTKANLARILMQGKLGGTGRMVILPVDQGFEHGPARSFAPNPAGYDPRYMFELALEAGLNAYAAPLGMIEAGASTYAGCIPTILKVNSSNSLSTTKDQAVTATVQDALRLGCSAIGFTIYPSSEYQFEMMEELRELAAEAKACGLAVVVWSYPRGPMLDKTGETALDICAYAAHMAALIGAHIIKVKPPTAAIGLDAAKKTYEKHPIEDNAAARIRHVVQSCFGGRRLVVFSGGEAKGNEAILDEVRAIHEGGGNGSIMGRNAFQRPKADALALLGAIINIYKH